MNDFALDHALDQWADDGGACPMECEYWNVEPNIDAVQADMDEMTKGTMLDGAPVEIVLLSFLEHKGIERLWLEVLAACHVTDQEILKIPVVPCPPWEMDARNMGAGVAVDKASGEIVSVRLGYGIGISSVYTRDQIKGIMAHELAHFVNRDPWSKTHSREQETLADEFAAKHGFAKSLASALEQGRNFVPGGAESDEASAADGIHPPTSKRVEYLNAMAAAA